MSNMDLFPLKQITEVSVRTVQKPDLENVAEVEGKAIIFQCDAVPFLDPSVSPNTKPLSLLVVDLLCRSVMYLKLKSKIHCLTSTELSYYFSHLLSVKFHVLQYCVQGLDSLCHFPDHLIHHRTFRAIQKC